MSGLPVICWHAAAWTPLNLRRSATAWRTTWSAGRTAAAPAAAACLNRAVTERRTLQLGPDVREIDSWGIDCYTRRNIHDGAPPQRPSWDLGLHVLQ